MAKVLIVEDSRVQAAQLTRELLRSPSGFEVKMAYDGREGLEMARAGRPDLIVLDIGLLHGDGLDVLRELRRGEATRDIPVVLATARETVEDQLAGFALGADDYVVKPYNTKVLVARIESVLRRRRQGQSPEKGAVFERHGLVVDRYRHQALLNGQTLSLTPTEFRLLELLIRRPGRVFSRSELMDALVGGDVAILEGTINVYIRNLRQKLGEGSRLIETVRGVGYRLQDVATAE